MNQIQQFIARFTWPQRIAIVTAAIAVAGGLSWLQHWNTERGFKPLFSGLAPEDAGAVTAQLRESQVDYHLSDNGGTILVPEDRVAEVRLQLAAAGLPQTGRMGFELFDQTNFGASEFAEQVNYHRAIEGELERSVISIREVERARVHVTMPKDSLYKEQRQPAKASVLVKLRPGAELTAANVSAIAHLAAAAVPGLKANQVTILDTAGNLLSRPRAAGLDGTGEANEGLLEYRKSVEREIENKVIATLDPLLGAGRFRASASAELDLTSGELSEEIFDPEKSVMVTSQTATDMPASAMAVSGGVPGTASNLPRPTAETAAGTAVPAYGRRTESIAYETSRTVRHTRLAQGAVKRMSLSVLVDHNLRYQDGKPVIEAPPAAQMQVIRDLVSAAVGLDTTRGDQLVVEAFPFESTRTAQPLNLDGTPTPAGPAPGLPLPQWLLDLVGGKAWMIAAAGAALALLLTGAGFFLWKQSRKKKQAAALATHRKEIAAASASDEAQRAMEARLAEQAAEQSRKEAEAILALKIPAVSTKKTEVLTKHLATEAKKDPQAMAHVVRSWLNGEYRR